jgi:hypothetical protein
MHCKDLLIPIVVYIVDWYSDTDMSKSINRASSVADYYKNYGYFYLTKTSQNYANTIESLANFDKQKVIDLERWYTQKID